jgi:hypothetical protein
MNERGYDDFLRGAIEEDDLLAEGLSIHKETMERICECLPANEAIEIGRKIDILVGTVIVQHLEAARLRPESVPEAAELIRQKTLEKLREMEGDR